MKNNILKNKRMYAYIKRYIMFMFKRFYGEYVVYGQENIPQEGPVIYAANHTNAFMDPLAVISVLPKETQIVYLARSDYFKNKRLRNILHYFKILPAFRMREGIEKLDKNYEVFDDCINVLNNNKPVGIMPEGNQGPIHRVRPLMKGIFRIAFGAQEKYGTENGVKIVPIGIDYGNADSFGHHIIINIGKPIEVAEYMAEYIENQAKGTNSLKNRLSTELKNLTIHFNTKDYYECCEKITRLISTQKKNKTMVLNVFSKRREIASQLTTFEQEKPQLLEQLNNNIVKLTNNLNKLGLKAWIFNKENYKTSDIIITTALLVLTIPFFGVGVLLNFFPFFAPDFILHALKIKLPGGLGSLRFGIGLFTFPVFYVLQGFLICKKIQAGLVFLLISFPLQYLLGRISFIWYKSFRKWQQKIRFKVLKHNETELVSETKSLYNEIIHAVGK
ncbi:MAG: 1-acyl-sn-glycerol-3-phosphate acyltransferase [Paludibacter sp.]|nr:1-acyl-sn-glycerol-3-phosphate acyltransferase [Paludibacter sp.]